MRTKEGKEVLGVHGGPGSQAMLADEPVGRPVPPSGRGLLDQPDLRLHSRDAAPQRHRLELPTGPPIHRWHTALMTQERLIRWSSTWL
jgi:hypothetical protein